MIKYSNSNHYIDPETGIFINLLRITSEEMLEKAEASAVAIRTYELSEKSLNGNFDFPHLKVIHKYLFQDIFEWAGQCRDIDIAKGGNFFAHHSHIEAAALNIFDRLADEKLLVGLSKNEFCDKAAYYLGEINALHPFREGNGRAQREFINQLAQHCNYYIEWKNWNPQDMVQASLESFKGDCSKFAAYIRSNIRQL